MACRQPPPVVSPSEGVTSVVCMDGSNGVAMQRTLGEPPSHQRGTLLVTGLPVPPLKIITTTERLGTVY